MNSAVSTGSLFASHYRLPYLIEKFFTPCLMGDERRFSMGSRLKCGVSSVSTSPVETLVRLIAWLARDLRLPRVFERLVSKCSYRATSVPVRSSHKRSGRRILQEAYRLGLRRYGRSIDCPFIIMASPAASDHQPVSRWESSKCRYRNHCHYPLREDDGHQ